MSPEKIRQTGRNLLQRGLGEHLGSVVQHGVLGEEVLVHVGDASTAESVADAVQHRAVVEEIGRDFLDILAIWYRDALLYKATADANHLVFRDEFQNIKKTASRTTYEGIEDVLKALDTAKSRLSANVSFDLIMELLLMTIKENS